jgi:hypothetical protein
MKKLIKLADMLDAANKVSAANRIDSVLSIASSIKPISPSSKPRNDDNKKDRNSDGKSGSGEFQQLLEDALDKITEDEPEQSISGEKKEITLKDLFNM